MPRVAMVSALCFSLFTPMFVLAGARRSGEGALPPVATDTTQSLVWYDAQRLTVEGRAFSDTESTWERLPRRAKAHVPPMVWWLSKHTAGLCVRFVTDSTTIAASWDGASAFRMNHMALTGSAGLDLYRREGKGWTYVATGRPQDKTTTAILLGTSSRPAPPKGPQEYLLYLPLYHPVSSLWIGVAQGASLCAAAPRPAARQLPIVFYGTSITQGGCAARPGMCHVAILGRWLDRPVVNLGFSGSGRGEPALAALVAEIPAAAYVLEPLPNMTTLEVCQRLPHWIDVLRSQHPTTPIVLVMNPLKPNDDEQNRALARVAAQARRRGHRHIYVISAEPQLAGRENGTVDGIHPTDLGFERMARAYYPLLARLCRP